jgi:hypothetical protein
LRASFYTLRRFYFSTNIKDEYKCSKYICEVVEDIKEKLTDCQYKIIMGNLMVLNEKKRETDEELEEEVDEE